MYAVKSSRLSLLDSSTQHTHLSRLSDTDEMLLGVTPSQRPDSPEFSRGDGVKTPPNIRSLHEEQTGDEEEGEEG